MWREMILNDLLMRFLLSNVYYKKFFFKYFYYLEKIINL